MSKLSQDELKSLRNRYLYCRRVLAQREADVSSAISEAERPYEYETMLEESAIELLDALKAAISVIDDMKLNNLLLNV